MNKHDERVGNTTPHTRYTNDDFRFLKSSFEPGDDDFRNLKSSFHVFEFAIASPSIAGLSVSHMHTYKYHLKPTIRRPLVLACRIKKSYVRKYVECHD